MIRTNRVCFHINSCKSSLIFAIISTVIWRQTQGHILEFAVEPVDTVVEAGQSAVLDCMVKPSHHQASILIQWLDQDRQKLSFIGDLFRSQLTNGSLYITSVIEEQRLTGSYQCMATLPNVGSVVSRIAKLTIAKLSGFFEEPTDLNVHIGQKAHFACRVDATPQPRIRWLKDERPLQIDELRMTILPSGALEIDEVFESDQGSYRCNASSLNTHKLSNKAYLIVNGDHEQAAHVAPPTFIAQPQPGVVVEGRNISLDCAANGNPNPTITWLKDGYAIDMNYLDSRFSLVGSTSSLRITNITEEDIGTYQCRAENREDSLDASATITVQVPPRFLKKPQDKTEIANKDVELECSVYGIPQPKITWYKNGEIIIPNEYYQIINGNNLKIMGLMVSDSGIFQCFASNAAGNIQSASSLRVINPESKRRKKVPPQPQQQQQQKSTLDKMQSIALFAHLKPENSAKLGDVDFGYLARKKFQQDSSHVHTSSSSNSDVYDPHSAFTSLKSSETNDNINLGDIQSAFFPTTAAASLKPFIADNTGQDDGGGGGGSRNGGNNHLPGPPEDLKALIVKARFVTLSWKTPLINGDNIQAYSVYYRQEGSERERVQNTTRSKLEEINIGGLSPNRVYHFRVVGINQYGHGQSSDSLTVTTQAEENVPSHPLQFLAYATSPHSIHVSWKPPEISNGEIQRYTVFYMETSSSIEHNIDEIDLQCDLTGLSVYTEYSLWVVAVNRNGRGAATEEKIVRTLGAEPTEPPSNVTVEPSSTSVIVRWEPPPLESQNGVITGYKLRYRKQSKKGLTITTPANERWYVLNQLERGTLYQVRLWAINLNGTSPPTDWIDVETYQNDLDETHVPDKPGSLRVRPTSDKLYVLWTPPTNQNIKVRNYILGWGKGIPDIYSEKLDEKARSYIIEKLESNSEYVLSLRASNEMGAGPPVYTTVRTEEQPPPEPQPPLIPPVGLKAQVLSSTSVVLYWTDTTLSKSQYVRDNRYYVVKYTAETATKNRYINVTDLNVMIDDLKPNTQYEFTVKLVKGRKESPWSMVVQNSTWEIALNAAPRDLDVHLKDNDSHLIELTWQPPKTTTNGRITGYIILYTDNKTKSDREWLAQAIKGDKHSSVLTDLKPLTEYYFKVQARNSRGNGPWSNVVIFTTGPNVGKLAASSGQPSDGQGLFSNTLIAYLLIGGCIVAVSTVAIVTAVLCCRRRDTTTTTTTTTSPDRSKKGYQKGTQNVKQPPDLWIHHDQMELKQIEKSQSNNDGASSSGAMTLPRSVGGGNDYDNHDVLHTNSLDKRTYAPNYVAIATPINTTSLSQSSTDSTSSSRPSYPRTQYNMPRAHVTVDPTICLNQQTNENPYSWQQQHLQQQPPEHQLPPVVAHIPSGAAYAPGLSVLAESQGGKRVPAQGHPLKSFTVPAPPPISAPGTPQPKHIVTVRPNSSPFKKQSTTPSSNNSSNTLTNTPPSRINPTNPPPHTAEEVQRLQPSHSTEELNQEMANLEGLMLTLNAITAKEFEC